MLRSVYRPCGSWLGVWAPPDVPAEPRIEQFLGRPTLQATPSNSSIQRAAAAGRAPPLMPGALGHTSDQAACQAPQALRAAALYVSGAILQREVLASTSADSPSLLDGVYSPAAPGPSAWGTTVPDCHG